jgi:hypothetical protein
MKQLLYIIFLLTLTTTLYGQEKFSEVNVDSQLFSEFEMLDDTLDDYKVYFTGENHSYTSFNTRFQVKFLKYLHQTQNVQHFVFEQSPAVGYLINEIIMNDKASHKLYLKKMFYDPFYKMVLALEKYNDTLSEEERVQIHGIDAERFPYFSIYALNELSDQRSITIPGGEVFEQIRAMATSDFAESAAAVYYADTDVALGFQFGDVNARESLLSIIRTAYEFEDSIKVELGEDSTIFYSIVQSLDVGEKWYNAEKRGDVQSPIIRERFMADAFADVYDPDSDEKYYGQFGRCHIHKDQDAGRCYDYYMNSIANRINDIDSSLDNEVLVIPLFYSNSKTFDAKVINGLKLDDQFKAEGKTFIIDLAYKNGDHPIIGFYNRLPFVIVSNVDKDEFSDWGFQFDDTFTSYHFGYYYGFYSFPKIRTLNNSLGSISSAEFNRNIVGHTISIDIYRFRRGGGRYAYTFYPSVNNGDRFKLKGYNFTLGAYVPFGNEYVAGGFGLNVGYGKFRLTEQTDNSVPNLFQSGGNTNLTIYENDVMVTDPNLELRLTLPIVSINIKGGYIFDLSGKYWRLGEKLKNYTKTSFSAPYFQIGASLHFKVRG